jgi:hypothetical protein
MAGHEYRYILDADLREVPCPDLLKWADWMETAERHVAEDWFGPYRISTVFLGLDYNLMPGAPPELYETMIFKMLNPGQISSRYLINRYATWAEAKEGHANAVEEVKAGTLP